MATYDLGTATGISDNDDIASAIKGVHDSGLSPAGVSQKLLSTRNSPINGTVMLDTSIDSPINIGDCTLWITGAESGYSSASEVAGDGESISRLQDQSGNNNYLALNRGSATYNAADKTIDCVDARFLPTSAFVKGDTYNNSISIFAVMEPDESVNDIRYKISLTNDDLWMGFNAADNTRRFQVAGLTGFDTNSESIIDLGGVDYMVISDDSVKISSDGIGDSSGASVTTGTYSTTGDTTITTGGSFFQIGGLFNEDGDGRWTGKIKEVILYRRALSDDEIRRVVTYLRKKYDNKETIVCEGNSLTSGVGSTSGATQELSITGDNYPSQLMAMLDLDKYKVRTDAYPGRRGDQLISETPYYSGVNYDGEKVTTVLWEGVNSLNYSKTVMRTYSDLVKACKMRQGPNKKVYIGTVLYNGKFDTDSYNIALTDRLNELIRENYSEFCDGVVDYAADERLSDYTNKTYFYTDDIHLTSEGYAVVASLTYDAIVG